MKRDDLELLNNAKELLKEEMTNASSVQSTAQGKIYGQLVQQSTLCAFINAYKIYAIAIVILIPLVLILKKFNVNPNGYYAVYNHQYMANLRAPASEASKSYDAYVESGLASLALEFTID